MTLRHRAERAVERVANAVEEAPTPDPDLGAGGETLLGWPCTAVRRSRTPMPGVVCAAGTLDRQVRPSSMQQCQPHFVGNSPEAEIDIRKLPITWVAHDHAQLVRGPRPICTDPLQWQFIAAIKNSNQ